MEEIHVHHSASENASNLDEGFAGRRPDGSCSKRCSDSAFCLQVGRALRRVDGSKCRQNGLVWG
jgi:hypothetical protein